MSIAPSGLIVPKADLSAGRVLPSNVQAAHSVGPNVVTPASVGKISARRSAKGITARGALRNMGRSFRNASLGRSSGIDAKEEQDKAYDATKKEDGTTPVPADEKIQAASPKDSGLKPAQKKKTGWRPYVAIPLVVGGLAAASKALQAAKANPAVGGYWEQIMAFIATLPGWAQTGLQVGGAFGVAWIAPKIVRAGFKFLFSNVDWDPLRESYITSLASAAAWFAATGYAVLVLGGALSLTLNLSVFAAATALASQDLAKNIAAGYKLYSSGRLRPSSRIIELWDEKGRVTDVNPRFTILDVSENPDVDYNRVLMLNEKLKDKVITNWSGSWPARLAAFAPLALLSPALAGPVGFVAQTVGVVLATLLVADLFNRRAKLWSERAKDALEGERDEDYVAFSKRSSILSWIRNGVYFAGLWGVLSIFGLPMTWTAFAMTVFSGAVGFYTKAVATDLVGGMAVAYWQPFVKGDYVQIAKIKGIVEDIDQSFLYIKGEEGGVSAVPLEQVMKEGKIKIGKRSK